MVIQLGVNHYFTLCMYAGKGSNTRAELLALSGLLFFSSARGIELQKILGDSLVIIDWAMKRHKFQTLALSH